MPTPSRAARRGLRRRPALRRAGARRRIGQHPERYYRTNVVGTLNLLDAMRAAGVERLVFSSTCAVYGQPDEVPITEDDADRARRTLRRVEAGGGRHDRRLLRRATGWARSACATSTSPARAATLGEDHDPETHLIPNVLRAALGIDADGGDLRHRLSDAATAPRSATTSTSRTSPRPICSRSTATAPASTASSTSGTATGSRSAR